MLVYVESDIFLYVFVEVLFPLFDVGQNIILCESYYRSRFKKKILHMC